MFTSQAMPPTDTHPSVVPLRAASDVVPEKRRRPDKIMLIDDEPINIKVVRKYLREAGYEDFVSTSDAREAIPLMHREMPDVVVLDIMMPHISGLQILQQIRADNKLKHVPVLVITAAVEDNTKTQALELGATDFLHKPVRPNELIPRVRNSLLLKAHHDHLADYSVHLEREVKLRTAELDQSRQELIRVLACAAEHRDHETGNHVVRVGRYAGLIARNLGLSEQFAQLIEQAAVLHDVGKIAIPDAILLKPGRLTDEEFAVMRGHCHHGWNILQCTPSLQGTLHHWNAQSSQCSPILELAASIAISHHERWDGTGYPFRIAGDAIPLPGRITAVADVFDALTSRRPYKEPFSPEASYRILEESRGTHFDPRVVDAFVACRETVTQIAKDLAD